VADTAMENSELGIRSVAMDLNDFRNSSRNPQHPQHRQGDHQQIELSPRFTALRVRRARLGTPVQARVEMSYSARLFAAYPT